MTEQSAHSVGVVDAVGPAAGVRGIFELVSGVGEDVSAAGGEEAEVVGGAGGELLGEQCGAAGEEAAVSGVEREEQGCATVV